MASLDRNSAGAPQFLVLLAQLPQLPDLGDAQAAVPLLPAVDACFADAELATQRLDRRARFGLARRHDPAGQLFGPRGFRLSRAMGTDREI